MITNNMKRRDFMKMAGLAIVSLTPTTFLKAEKEYSDIEFELHFPYSVFNAETKKCWNLSMENPADRAISFLLNCDCLELIDWESFKKWSIYCKQKNLKVKNQNFNRDKNAIDILCDLAFKGNALLLFVSGKIYAKVHKTISSELYGYNPSIVIFDDIFANQKGK